MTFNENDVTLAIAPTARGLGYVAFENPTLIMDFGVKEVRKNKLRDCLLKASVLMHMLQASMLVLEDVRKPDCRRAKRVKVLIEKLAEIAEKRGMTVVRCSRADTLAMFDNMGAHNKDDIAATVVKLIPELEPRLPPRRRVWESEHYNMGIFEAAALALTVFNKTGLRKDTAQ